MRCGSSRVPQDVVDLGGEGLVLTAVAAVLDRAVELGDAAVRVAGQVRDLDATLRVLAADATEDDHHRAVLDTGLRLRARQQHADVAAGAAAVEQQVAVELPDLHAGPVSGELADRLRA